MDSLLSTRSSSFIGRSTGERKLQGENSLRKLIKYNIMRKDKKEEGV